MSTDFSFLTVAVFRAVQAAAALVVAHLLGVGFILYMDLTGQWAPYALCKSRPSKTVSNYLPGLQSLAFDLVFLFIPCLSVCLWYQSNAIVFDIAPPGFADFLQATIKCLSGYVLGKVWAFVLHYALHHPSLYRYHKKHHQKPANLVASAAWDDSAIEYAIMELPSFCLTLFVFPTYWWFHLVHFALHGLDGAAGHSGFSAPGLLGTCLVCVTTAVAVAQVCGRALQLTLRIFEILSRLHI